MKSRSIISAPAMLVSLAVMAVAALCPQLARAAVVTYDVTGWIDTSDYLYVQGSTLQWEHKTSGSPAGLHGAGQPTVISSTLGGVSEMNDVDWEQTWPSPRPADAFSSVFTGLDPALTLTGAISASVEKISGRGTPTIVQQPTAANDDTLIVEFSDGGTGAQDLDVLITVTPEPASSLSFLGVGVAVILRRQRRAEASAQF